MSQSDFDREILERLGYCIDSALGFFGTNVKKAVYWDFETEYGMSKDKIPLHISEFVSLLRGMFGPQASLIVERKIMREIISEFQLSPKNYPTIDLPRLVNELLNLNNDIPDRAETK